MRRRGRGEDHRLDGVVAEHRVELLDGAHLRVALGEHPQLGGVAVAQRAQPQLGALGDVAGQVGTPVAAAHHRHADRLRSGHDAPRSARLPRRIGQSPCTSIPPGIARDHVHHCMNACRPLPLLCIWRLARSMRSSSVDAAHAASSVSRRLSTIYAGSCPSTRPAAASTAQERASCGEASQGGTAPATCRSSAVAHPREDRQRADPLRQRLAHREAARGRGRGRRRPPVRWIGTG